MGNAGKAKAGRYVVICTWFGCMYGVCTVLCGRRCRSNRVGSLPRKRKEQKGTPC
jgi:hypothetical protein